MIGSIAEPPSAIRRTAATKSGTSLIRSLSRYPAPSAVSAKSLSARPTSTYCDSTSTPTSGWLGADLERRPEALVLMGRREPDVDDRDVRRVASHLQHQILGGLAAADDVEVGRRGARPRRPRGAARCPRRSRRAWDLRPDPGTAAGRAPDSKPAVERFDAVGDAAQSAAALRIGASDPVVGHLDRARSRSGG